MKYLDKLFALTILICSSTFGQTPNIAVAANMKPAIEELQILYKATPKPEFKIIYGSSGNFYSQIRNGAPYSLFISADEQYPLELAGAGLTQGYGKTYAIGRLALITNKNFPYKPSFTTSELKKIISESNKISIAKPDLAPYGKASLQFLSKIGLLDDAKDKFVFGENISSATVYVSTGAANVGFTALSLATNQEVAKTTNFIAIPDSLYEPIKQRMVLLKNAPPVVVEFYDFLQTPKAKDILRAHGYAVP
jgi:molybdate transport system substrate-binding protein